MFVVYLLSWWYSRGWAWSVSSIFTQLREINETFSIPILLKTWFSPWKQITTPSSFRNFFQAAIDNLVSRFVGAAVRTCLIFGGLFASLFITIAGFLTILLWPLVPLSIIIFPVLFLVGGI